MIYVLEAYNTDRRSDDVWWREYTTSKKKAQLFERIPKIQFTNSNNDIVFSACRHNGPQKPEIRRITDYVQSQLELLKTTDKTAKQLTFKQLEILCRQLAEACEEALTQLDPLEKGDSKFCENVIKSIEAALEAAKKTGIIT